VEHSLIAIPDELEDKDGLVETQRKAHEEALTNLVTGKTPREVVYQRPAARGMNVDYVPGWWFVQQLNALFSYFWDFEIEEQSIGQDSCWVKGKLTITDPKSGLKVTKSAFGGSRLKSKENIAIDIGDDLKTAATDALKKAATLLGIASDIYGKREVLSETSGTKSQLNSLYTMGEKKGISTDTIKDISEKKFGKQPEELTSLDLLALIREVRSK
jgi:hypothetical protein